MSIQARLDTLAQRHQALEAALAEERRHAAFDDIRVTALKRRKLAIKDEINALLQKTGDDRWLASQIEQMLARSAQRLAASDSIPPSVAG